MSGMSPSSVLFSSDGYEMAVVSGSAVTSGTRALLISGVDGYTGNARYIPATSLGVLGTTEMSNTFSVLNNFTVTGSDSQLITFNNFGTQEIALVVNVGTVTGAGNITFTIQEVDPGDGVTVYGNSASTTAISSGNAPGVFTAVLNISTSTKAKVSWTVAGGAFSAPIYATVVSKATPATQTINGSISATNPSVGTDAAAALGFDTQVGGIVSLNNPTYTAGNLNALSLTTEGGLRVFADGYVTTAAPTYTNNTSAGLSLNTAGDLRVVANQGTNPWTVNGTVTANQGGSWTVAATQSGAWTVSITGTVGVTQSTSPWVISGNGTAGSPDAGVVTIQGIAGMTHLSDDGYAFATSAAPSYTNSTWNPMSLDLAGNLRVAAVQSGTWSVVTNKAATSSVTSTSASTSSVTILASNANRVAATVYNTSSKVMYVKLGATASTSSFTTQLFANSYWEVPNDYTGIIDAIWAGTGGAAVVTELTP